MNHTQLTAYLQNWVESAETTMVANLDEMIRYGELRIYRSIDFAVLRDEDTSITVTQGQATETLPANTITVRSVAILSGSTRTFLDQKDSSYIDDYTNDRTTEGTPRFYAFYDQTTLLLGPAPDNSTDTLVINRTTLPTAMTAGNLTTYIGDTYPDLLLHSCLLELATYLKEEPDIIQEYDKKYQMALQSALVEENHRNRYDRYRHGEIRIGQ